MRNKNFAPLAFALSLLFAAEAASARPVVVGHRGMGKGVRGGYAENTVPSLVRALAIGAHMVEFDVRLSACGTVVLHHDERVAVRGREARVRDLPLRDLRRATVHGRAVRIPTLEELLDRVARHRFTPHLNVEIKIEDPADTAELVAKTLAILRARGLLASAVISSFDFEAVALAKRLEPDVRAGLLCEHAREGLAKVVAHNATAASPIDAVIPEWSRPGRKTPQLSGRFLRAAHAARVLVGVYTVNDPAEMRRLAGEHLDFLITDLPALALAEYGYRR